MPFMNNWSVNVADLGNPNIADRGAETGKPSDQLRQHKAASPLSLIMPAIGRLRGAMADPRGTWRFLRETVHLSTETSKRVIREGPNDPWRSSLDRKERWDKIKNRLVQTVFDPPAPRYVLHVRKSPVCSRRPRILHVIPNVFVGGSTQLVVDLHEHLGHLFEMEVLTAAIPPGGAHTGMVIRRVGLGAPPAAFQLAVRSARADLVHLHYWGAGDDPWYQAAMEALRETQVPIIQNVNTPVAPLRDERIAATAFVSTYVRDTFAPDMTQGKVIWPGVDLTAFSRSEPPNENARDTALMVYRLENDKLGPESIEAAIAAIRSRPRTRVIVVGEGPLLPLFVARARESGCRDKIDFRGYVPYRDLPGLYAQASVFLAPVIRESFGQVVPFAMAMGLAVVGNRVGALPEILGGDAVLGADSRQTGEILARILDDSEWLMQASQRNRTRAGAFALDTMVAQYEALYRETLAKCHIADVSVFSSSS